MEGWVLDLEVPNSSIQSSNHPNKFGAMERLSRQQLSAAPGRLDSEKAASRIEA